MVSVDVKHHVYLLHPWLGLLGVGRAQELCESRGGCPELPVPNSPYGLRGRKATLILQKKVGVGAKSGLVGGDELSGAGCCVVRSFDVFNARVASTERGSGGDRDPRRWENRELDLTLRCHHQKQSSTIPNATLSPSEAELNYT